MDYTDVEAWEKENKEFLTKIGQVAEPKPTKSKKEED